MVREDWPLKSWLITNAGGMRQRFLVKQMTTGLEEGLQDLRKHLRSWKLKSVNKWIAINEKINGGWTLPGFFPNGTGQSQRTSSNLEFQWYEYEVGFIENCRKPVVQRATGELTCDELKRTGGRLINEAQHDAFLEEMKALATGKELPKKSSILAFTPMVTIGILRSDTRLRYSNDLPDEMKYPIILPKKHSVTELLLSSRGRGKWNGLELHTQSSSWEEHGGSWKRNSKQSYQRMSWVSEAIQRKTSFTANGSPTYNTTRSYHEAIYQLRSRFF